MDDALLNEQVEELRAGIYAAFEEYYAYQKHIPYNHSVIFRRIFERKQRLSDELTALVGRERARQIHDECLDRAVKTVFPDIYEKEQKRLAKRNMSEIFHTTKQA